MSANKVFIFIIFSAVTYFDNYVRLTQNPRSQVCFPKKHLLHQALTCPVFYLLGYSNPSLVLCKSEHSPQASPPQCTNKTDVLDPSITLLPFEETKKMKLLNLLIQPLLFYRESEPLSFGVAKQTCLE